MVKFDRVNQNTQPSAKGGVGVGELLYSKQGLSLWCAGSLGSLQRIGWWRTGLGERVSDFFKVSFRLASGIPLFFVFQNDIAAVFAGI
jgi:hypothetical protein